MQYTDVRKYSTYLKLHPNPSQAALLRVYLCVWKFAWDFSLALFRMQLSMHSVAKCGSLPTEDWLVDKVLSLDRKILPPVPDSLLRQAAVRLSNMYMRCLYSGLKLPEPYMQQKIGAFRLEPCDCRIDLEGKRVSFGDTLWMPADGLEISGDAIKETRLVQVRCLCKDSWSALLLRYRHPSEIPQHVKISPEDLPEEAIAVPDIVKPEEQA